MRSHPAFPAGSGRNRGCFSRGAFGRAVSRAPRGALGGGKRAPVFALRPRAGSAAAGAAGVRRGQRLQPASRWVLDALRRGGGRGRRGRGGARRGQLGAARDAAVGARQAHLPQRGAPLADRPAGGDGHPGGALRRAFPPCLPCRPGAGAASHAARCWGSRRSGRTRCRASRARHGTGCASTSTRCTTSRRASTAWRTAVAASTAIPTGCTSLASTRSAPSARATAGSRTHPCASTFLVSARSVHPDLGRVPQLHSRLAPPQVPDADP